MLFWKSWIDAAQFGLEAQSVIAIRLLKIATGGQDAAAEFTRMVLEKVDAAAAAHTAGALALVGGKSVEAAQNSRWRRSSAASTPILDKNILLLLVTLSLD